MKVVVAAWIGSSNLGDELIFRALLHLLGRQGISPEEITAISINPRKTAASFGVKTVWHLDPWAVSAVIKQADLVIFGGGGILQDSTSVWSVPYHCSRIWISRLFSKPLLAIGIGVGPLDTGIGRWLAKVTFAGVPDIVVRDQASQDQLCRIGIMQSTVGADLALSLPVFEGKEGSCIVVCLRHFAPKGGLVPSKLQNPEAGKGYIRSLASALDKASMSLELPIRFVSFDAERDTQFHRAIATNMAAEFSFADANLDNVFSELGAAKAVIAMRYHAGIVAVLAGKPCLLISYSPKLESLATELGDACRIIPNAERHFTRIPGLVEELLDKDALVVSARNRIISANDINREKLSRFLRG